MPRRTEANASKAPKSRYRLFAWAVVMSLLFGLIGAGDFPEDRLRIIRNHINEKPVSGDIVFVGIDDKSTREIGRWPWPRSTMAELTVKIDAAKPKRQVHDLVYDSLTTPEEDAKLRLAFAQSPDIMTGILPKPGREVDKESLLTTVPMFRDVTRQAWIYANYNYSSEVWHLQRGARFGSQYYPSISSVLAGQGHLARVDGYRVNYAFNPASVPYISAADVAKGRVDPARLRGKSVILAIASDTLGDRYFVPGWTREAGAYVIVLGAETLKAGGTSDLGWFPALAIAFGLGLASIYFARFSPLIFALGFLTLLATPLMLERYQIFADVVPALFCLTWIAIGMTIRRMNRRGLVNAVSGLPNLIALRRAKHERDRPLVVARIINYANIVSTFSITQEKQLIDQIVGRLRVGSEVTTIYQGDEGVFAWTVPATTAIGHHIEALHALFRSPAKVDKKPFDIAISFGVEIGSGRSLANRLGSAMVAADEANTEGLRWKYHDPERMKDADWRLSLLSQLDEAIDKGEVWVAYQPQLDLRTGLIRGAEALARWTHPEKGPISPTEFVAAAEQNDRIEKLSMFVLDAAIAVAADINRGNGPFDMAVNISARLLQDRGLPARVRGLLDKHRLPAERLTLELTETAALADNGTDLDALVRLRDLGVKISIDDYGTGLSTLDYLKKVPANEIKIDQSFVKAMRDQRSDLVMVQSTIALAHSLGRTVVAEGVEDREVLDLLTSMHCEYAQGFVIGRPTSVAGLKKRLVTDRNRRVA
jgi:EAL domain-containing protein (putative c-di-GMP-specific phosphodiesterase class I)/CHASE2 domain-containing sensor protein